MFILALPAAKAAPRFAGAAAAAAAAAFGGAL
jgi:hypothetical protein